MLSYRHAFHAGNHADVLKHFVLVQLLEYFNQKDKPYWYIDTHAGAGCYALDEAFARKNAEFVAQEEMKRSEGYWWSPDSRRIAFAEVDESPVETWTLCDPARPERACQQLPYPAAGKANARVRLGVVKVAGGSPAWVRWDDARFPYLATVRWQAGGPLALLVMDRRQRG